MEERNFKNLSNHVAYLSSFIIFLGMVYNIYFYRYFGVRIVSYLSFSEIITSFFEILIVILLSIALLIIQFYIALNKEELKKDSVFKTRILNETKSIKIFWLYLKYHYVYFIVIVILFSCYFFSDIHLSQNIKEKALLSCVLAIFIIAFSVAELELKRKYISLHTKKPWFIDIVLYCVMLTFFIVYFSHYQAKMIKKNKATFGVIIILEDNTQLISDSSNYFIGKTDSYIFFHHEKTNRTDIFPVSRIKQLTIESTNPLDFYLRQNQ
jgi:hypothetical protein